MGAKRKKRADDEIENKKEKRQWLSLKVNFDVLDKQEDVGDEDGKEKKDEIENENETEHEDANKDNYNDEGEDNGNVNIYIGMEKMKSKYSILMMIAIMRTGYLISSLNKID